MRKFNHWTPRYIYHRLALSIYQQRQPNAPWLVRTMVNLLDNWLTPTDRGIEWGSGRSTIWFAMRVGSLVSVEHDPGWYRRVKGALDQHKLMNVEYHLCEDESAYRAMTTAFTAGSFDFCLVDGLVRDDCALAAISLVKPGGIIVVDNCNCYLPSNSFSPYSRKPEQGCYTEKWAAYLDAVTGWRRVWLTDGVCDTGLWMKPGSAIRAVDSRGASNRISTLSPVESEARSY